MHHPRAVKGLNKHLLVNVESLCYQRAGRWKSNRSTQARLLLEILIVRMCGCCYRHCLVTDFFFKLLDANINFLDSTDTGTD